MEDMIEKRGLVEEELRKTKELLRHERDKWKVEKETFNQVLCRRWRGRPLIRYCGRWRVGTVEGEGVF